MYKGLLRSHLNILHNHEKLDSPLMSYESWSRVWLSNFLSQTIIPYITPDAYHSAMYTHIPLDCS